ncbi:NADH dehydrogenase I chain B [Alicycliphilus sp. B1]|nr:NADH dehydrogenase I chain B [Alicycliphilus sp. B1]
MPASGKGTLRQSSAGLQASKASALAATGRQAVGRDMAGIIPKQAPGPANFSRPAQSHAGMCGSGAAAQSRRNCTLTGCHDGETVWDSRNGWWPAPWRRASPWVP